MIQLKFRKWIEAVEFPGEFTVKVNTSYPDMPKLNIPGWGIVNLLYRGSSYIEEPFWSVQMISGEKPGAGTVLYFAALLWALTEGDKIIQKLKERPANGRIGSDSTLSPDAIRARLRMQNQYADYLQITPNTVDDEIKVHRGDNTDWRRKATPEETNIWRLKKMPPFKFNFN